MASEGFWEGLKHLCPMNETSRKSKESSFASENYIQFY